MNRARDEPPLAEATRESLQARRRQLDEEIRGYPTPIPRCDAQFNHLFEQRLRVMRELATLDEAGRAGVVNLAEKFSRFAERWSPRIVARMNDYELKLVKLEGEFVWHSHRDTDEVFIVIEGEMTIHFRDRDVAVRAGELFVIPRGVEHKTSAARECRAMLVESAGTVNTGEAGGEKTAPGDAWV